MESFVVTLQDLTPLEELERQRAEFLGVVSHELRTPLASIKGSATTLKESANSLDPAEMDLFFRIIEQQADQMSDLITDLLDMARIESGTLSVSPEPSEAAALVDRARNSFLSGGGRDNIRIDVEPDLPPVMADRRRIAQVIGNLLSNAARHSPESSAIRLAAARDGVQVALYRRRRRHGPVRRAAASVVPEVLPDRRGTTVRAALRVRDWAWPSARG